jgi:hypothetical protein
MLAYLPLVALQPSRYAFRVKKKTSKKKLTPIIPPKLSKSDPDYYAKIGKISALKRKLKPSVFSEMAKRSHPRPEYRGGRPPTKDE